MSASTFKILKQCLHCGTMFEAQKVSTKYCTHKCNSAHYKLKQRQNKKEKMETAIFKPKVTALSKALIKDKEFLSVKETASLLGCSRQTVYTIINAGKLKATNLNIKKTLVKRSIIDKMFE